MSKTYTEQNIADLMTRFAGEVESDAAESRVSERVSSRRTVIIPDTPTQGYTVSFADGYVDVTVEDAPTRGEAVLRAAAMVKVSGALPNVGMYLFMWNYTVTGADGETVRGGEMREEVQAARMAREVVRSNG